MLQSSPVRWTTEDVGPAQRFEYWRESICAAFDPMSPEMAAAERAGFRGDIRAWSLGEASLMEIRATAHVTGRSARDISHGSHDYVFLYRQREEAWFDRQDGTDFVSRAGAVVLGHADRVFATGPTADRPFGHAVLKLPRRLLEPMLAQSEDIATTVISAERGMGALLAGYFDAFIAQAPTLAPEEVRLALDCLGSLAASAYGRLAPQHDPRAALRQARLRLALQAIDASLDGAALSPAAVARAVGVSLRVLHRLFEPTGVSVARHIQRRRLALARHRLASRPYDTVLQVALECGFGSLATFYRAFGETYGISPAACRAGTLAARDAMPADAQR